MNKIIENFSFYTCCLCIVLGVIYQNVILVNAGVGLLIYGELRRMKSNV